MIVCKLYFPMSVNCTFLITILRYLEAKCDYSYIIIIFVLRLQDPTKKFQVILSQNEGMTAIFPNFDLNLNWKYCCHALIFARNDLNFFCVELWKPNAIKI